MMVDVLGAIAASLVVYHRMRFFNSLFLFFYLKTVWFIVYREGTVTNQK